MLPFLPDARRVRTCAMRLRVCRVLHGRLHFGSAVPARVRGVPKIGVSGVSCVAWKVEVLGPSGMLGGVSAPGLSGKRAVSGGLRSAPSCSRVLAFPASRFSPRPGFLGLPFPCPAAVAGFPAAGSADVSFCFDLFRCEIRKKDGNCGIRASIRPETGAESPRLCRFRPSRIYITFCTVYL
jgi:hypothetical protein